MDDGDETWQPLLGVLGAILLAVPSWAWSRSQEGAWGPVLLYALLGAVGAWWLWEQQARRTFAAYLIAAALVLAFLLPFGWIPVAPPER